MTVVIGYSVGTSSNLSEIGYEPASREFYVRFRNGGQGAYSGDEIEDATAVIRATDFDKDGRQSHGATLIKRLKVTGRPYRQMSHMPWDDSAGSLLDVSDYCGFVRTMSRAAFLSKFLDYADLLRNAVVYA